MKYNEAMQNPFLTTKYLITETDPLRLPHIDAEVAFVGRSNVGKSSLMCGLCENKKLARVSKTPGRTRAINVFEVHHGKWLVDLPGYGYADAPEKERNYWPEMIGHYLGGRPNLKCVFVLVDSFVGASPLDQELLIWLKEKQIPYKVVGTKADRLTQNEQKHHRTEIAKSIGQTFESLAWVSSKEGYGMKSFRQDVMKALGMKS